MAKNYESNSHTEIWLDSKEFPGIIEVSNFGGVRTKDRVIKYSNGRESFCKGHQLSKTKDKQGYQRVTVSVKNKVYNRKVHRLVAESFLHKPKNKSEVNHVNGIKDDNRVSNLEWVDHSENVKHAVDTGLYKLTETQSLRKTNRMRGQQNPSAKLSDADVEQIRELRKKGTTLKELSKRFNVSSGYVCLLCKNKYR